ncbi:Uncharacterised protein [Chlamydia trachomatis]|nr:Uncharacterised protein [Chlamydia trachomatis]
MPFIEKSDIAAITFQKGAVRLIFVSDIFNCEAFIFNYILHEITHCFFANKDEKQIDEIYVNTYYEIKEKFNLKYKGIDDALKARKQCFEINHKERKGEFCDIKKEIFLKYKKVSFN